ncbi:PfkB family carbohydrate kinase [Alphaproteobacteria bacterium]|nr:PfkB family carbohydrate kinase [Alphaproteobacteria bacterium]
MHLDISAAARLINDIQDCHIVVVGDLMLDRFVDGAVTRISPEAPVPVLSQSTSQQMPGGAANVACNLAQLGAQVTLIGACGDDATAADLAAELRHFPRITFIPVTVAGRPTSLKTRYRASGQQMLRVDDEVSIPISDSAQAELSDRANAVIDTADMLILSDYAKGCLPLTLIRSLIDAARAAKKLTVADPKLADLSVYRDVDVLTPNLQELASAAGTSLTELDAIGMTAAQMAKTHNIGTIMTTLSARGILASQGDGTQFHDPARTRDVFDVSGAGDTVVAVISAAIASGAQLELAVSLANHAAGVAVGKSGTAIVTAGEILAHMPLSKPVIEASALAGICQDWRDAGDKIAFTNGCFDLLHPGHLHLLRQAAATADRLVVGLNSDASVRRLKGDTRPLQRAEQRAAALAAFDLVDAVCIFEEDTPQNLISLLQPDFIVKGGDYQPADVIGGDIVKKRGGKVVIVPTHAAYSTSKLITSR